MPCIHDINMYISFCRLISFTWIPKRTKKFPGVSPRSKTLYLIANTLWHYYILPSSWFYESCSRDEAENILTVGRKFGNVLMRPSSTFAQTGKYVISMRREVSGWVTQRPANVLYVTCRSRDWNDESQHKVVTSFWTLLQRNKLESLWSHQEIGRLQNQRRQ